MSTNTTRGRILDYLALESDATVAHLAAALSTARSTVQRALDAMVEQRELRVLEEKSSGGRGRRSRRYQLAERPRPVLVYIEAPEEVVVRAVERDGTVLGAASTRRESAGPLTIDQIIELFRCAAENAGREIADFAGAVVGVPGPVTTLRSGDPAPHRRSAFASWGSNPPSIRQLQTWAGEDPVEVLETRLGLRAVMENDGNLSALGESLLGAGRGGHIVLCLSLVRTTGGGIVVDGQLRPGRSGMAGEIGHLSVRADGPLCPCGNRGCFWSEAGYETLRIELSTVVGHDLSPADVAARVAAGDSVFVAALRDFGARIGSIIAPVVGILDPDIIIVDGALGAAAETVTVGMREALVRDSSPLAARDLRVTSGELGDAAPFVGGAAHFHRSLPAATPAHV